MDLARAAVWSVSVWVGWVRSGTVGCFASDKLQITGLQEGKRQLSGLICHPDFE
jgi:hypothetical protein